jgi:hypothetical protein
MSLVWSGLQSLAHLLLLKGRESDSLQLTTVSKWYGVLEGSINWYIWCTPLILQQVPFEALGSILSTTGF